MRPGIISDNLHSRCDDIIVKSNVGIIKRTVRWRKRKSVFRLLLAFLGTGENIKIEGKEADEDLSLLSSVI